MTIDITISFVIRFLLVFIFLRAALHKVNHYQHFKVQLRTYRLLPDSLVPAFTIFLIFLEGILSFTLPIAGWLYPSYIAAAVLVLYASAMAVNLLNGRSDLDCGCSGPWGFPQTISWSRVVRNAVLAILAVATAWPDTFRDISIQDGSTISLASIAVIFIYASIEQAFANQQRQRRYFALRAEVNS